MLSDLHGHNSATIKLGIWAGRGDRVYKIRSIAIYDLDGPHVTKWYTHENKPVLSKKRSGSKIELADQSLAHIRNA